MKFKLDFKRLFGAAVDRLFAVGLTDPDSFSLAVRPILEGHADGDIHRAQSLALQGLQDYAHVVQKYSNSFLKGISDSVSFEGLRVPIAGKQGTPVGTGHGLDPNAEGLDILSMLFGFQTPGPVCVHARSMEAAPFRDDSGWNDLYLPPEFASHGLERFRLNISQYRERGGQAILFAAIVGMPNDTGTVESAHQELQQLVRELAPYVDGFVWVPQLSGCVQLRTAPACHTAASLMSAAAPTHLKLMELPGCSESNQPDRLVLADSFLAGGGEGLVAVGGLEVTRQQVPRPQSWPFAHAIKSGGSLAMCRQWLIEELRRRHPSSFLAACGGFHNGSEAISACEHANVIMETEAFTRYGPGMARKLLTRLSRRMSFLQKKGTVPSGTLHELQQSLWSRQSDDSARRESANGLSRWRPASASPHEVLPVKTPRDQIRNVRLRATGLSVCALLRQDAAVTGGARASTAARCRSHGGARASTAARCRSHGGLALLLRQDAAVTGGGATH